MAEPKDYLNLSIDELQKYISKEFSNVLYSYPISAMEARAGIYLAELPDGSLYLDTLNLRPNVQGQGKGKEILEILKNWANENQVAIYLKPAALPDNPTYRGVELTPTEQTEKLFNFYKSNGWEENPNFTALSSNEKEAQLSLSAFKEWGAKTDDLYSPLVYLPTDVFVTDLPKNPYKDDIISYVEKYNKEGKIFTEGYNQPILDEIITEVLKMEVYFGTGGFMEEDDWKKSKLRDVAIELENNGIHPNDVDDISKYIPRDKIPTPAEIYQGGVRNEFFTDGIVDMLSKNAGSFYAINEEGDELFPENAPKRDMRLYHAIAQEEEEAIKLIQKYVQDRSSAFSGSPKQLNWIQYTSEGDKILDVETPLDTPTNVVDDVPETVESKLQGILNATQDDILNQIDEIQTKAQELVDREGAIRGRYVDGEIQFFYVDGSKKGERVPESDPRIVNERLQQILNNEPGQLNDPRLSQAGSGTQQSVSDLEEFIKIYRSIDTPTNVVDDANVYYHSRIEKLSDASDTHFGTYNAALDRASLQYGKENIKEFYTRALENVYDAMIEELDGLEYVIKDGEYTLPTKQIQFNFEHFNRAVPQKSQELQFLIELDGYQGIDLYVLDDGYPIEIERFDAGGLLYDAEEDKITEFRNTDAEYVFGRKEDFATQDVYVSRIQDGVPVDVYQGDFDIDSKYNLYEMKIKPDAKVFDISGKDIEIVNTFRKQGESTYNTKSTVVSSEFLQYELFAENAPGLGKVSEIKIDGVSYKPESGVFQNKEEIIQVLADDADIIIYTNEIEDAGSSSLYVRNADAVDVSLVDEERLNVFNEDVNTKYYQTSPLDEDLLRKLDQGKITQEQYDKYKQPFTDTPTNVVDDGPALLESRMKLDTSTGPNKSLADWGDDVIQPNKIYAPNKMETTKIGTMNSTFKSGEEVIEAINKGIATDEDITRFFIYVASKSPYEIYPTHQMFKPDAIADIVKIGIFSEIPLLQLLPLNTQTANMNVRFTQALVNDIHLKDIGIKQILDMANEQGQFTNLKERMRNNILDAHNKIYLENPNDYFILWRGGNLGRFSTWQSMSKSQSEASNVQYFMDEVSINKGRQTNTFVINQNNMIDLDALGLSYGTEKEVIVLTEAANKPGAKIPDLILDELDLQNYVESWIAKSTRPGRFPKQGYDIQNITKQLNPLGQETQNFFSELISGMNPDLKPNRAYQQIIELNHPQLAKAQDIYNKYVLRGGDFNPHYYTSIPTVYEAQIVKAQALVNMLKDGNFVDSPFGDKINILDIGGTEGTWSNTVAELGGNQFYVENLEPNPKANELYNAMETPANSEIRNQAFSYLVDDQGKYFDKPSEVKFADFGAGGPADKTTGIRNPNINEFGSSRRYQVVHESMTFQFVDRNRKAQVDFIADNLLTDDGVLLIEEKFTNNDVIYKNNENMKDDFKRNYYTEEQINSKAQNIVGPMGDKQVSVQEIEKILGNRFKYVNQYWDSGNFKGYIASNNPLAETFVDEIHLLETSLTNHGYSTAPTKEELKYAVQKDMRNRGINIELAKDVAKRFVEGNTQFIQSASDALGEVYKVGKAVAPAVGSLALRGLSKAAPVLAPGDVLVEGALAKTAPYVDDFAKRLGFASLPLASIINTYIAADIAAAGAEVVSAAMYAYDESQRNAPKQGSKFQESLTKFLLPKAYEDEAVQKLQIPQDLESFYRTPAGQQFLEDNDFGSLFKKQIDQEKLTKYAPGWQLSKAIFSLFGSMGREQANISEKTRGNMGQALLTGIGK